MDMQTLAQHAQDAAAYALVSRDEIGWQTTPQQEHARAELLAEKAEALVALATQVAATYRAYAQQMATRFV